MPEKEGKIREVTPEEMAEYFNADPGQTNLLEVRRAKKKKPRSVYDHEKELSPRPPLDIEKVIFTQHALNQFIDRYEDLDLGDKLNEPQKVALLILSYAKEEGVISSSAKMTRALIHPLEKTRYFSHKGWRFVVLEKGNRFIIKTIERRLD